MSDAEMISILETKRYEAGPMAGSLVTLKTGGPLMVVEQRDGNRAHCIWHNNDGDIFKDWIPVVCLKVKT